MDIIGKVYKDYYANSNDLDGNSHLLEKYTRGGAFNLINDWKILKDNFQNINCFFYLITNNKNLNYESKNLKFLYTTEECPTALIFDLKGKRTSFVINDDPIIIPIFKKTSNVALIFYGDKLISEDINNYKEIFIDTSCNKYEDIYALANSKNYPPKSIISISSELLNDELIELFTIERDFIVISHSPEKTEIIEKNNSSKIIQNEYYKKPTSIRKNIRVTGLGDKFIFLIAMYYHYCNLNLTQSVKKSQKFITNFFIE